MSKWLSERDALLKEAQDILKTARETLELELPELVGAQQEAYKTAALVNIYKNLQYASYVNALQNPQ
jgi:hypothetical protein